MNRRYRKTIIAGNWKMNNTLSQMKAFADLVEQAEAEQGVLAEPGGPRCGQGGVRADGVQYVPAALHFHMMPLSVVETDRKDAIETVEGPSEAGRGVLSAGKNDKGRRVCIAGHMLS